MELDKIKIKEAMNEYLKGKGWPDVPTPDDFIISHLKPMFQDLVDKGLVKPEYYKVYEVAATHQFLKKSTGV